MTLLSSCFTSPSKMPECAGDETLNGPLPWANLPSSSANVFQEQRDDNNRHRGTDDDRSARTLAVKSRAYGAPYRASGLDRSVRPSKVDDRADDAELSMDRNQNSPCTEIPYTKLLTLPSISTTRSVRPTAASSWRSGTRITTSAASRRCTSTTWPAARRW